MSLLPRQVAKIVEPQEVMEGAGVRLRRSIGTETLNYLDPFLLLDHFSSRDAADYEAGFPMHPHRGIETVTYLLTGEIHHRDTVGNSGSIRAGDLQWMSAGGGILHEEMPQVRPEGIDGFQLWVNLPAKLKMSRPRYLGLSADQITETEVDGSTIRIIAGSVGAATGPVTGIAADPVYMDVLVPPDTEFRHQITRGHNAFAYVFRGRARFGGDVGGSGETVAQTRLVVLGDGDYVRVATSAEPVRFLLISGKPLLEPIARYGPFVMNTKQEIERALSDLRAGTFVWSEKS